MAKKCYETGCDKPAEKTQYGDHLCAKHAIDHRARISRALGHFAAQRFNTNGVSTEVIEETWET